MFHDYLEKYPAGGTQHAAPGLSVTGQRFERITNELRAQGYELINEVDHTIARMAFFDTYRTLGVVTEIRESRRKAGSLSGTCKRHRERNQS